MAHMYPESLEGLDVRSHAEADLFRAFQEGVSDHFHVFYSVAWLGIRWPGSAPADGEADFVVVHPAMGVLVIEVKGGQVGYDAGRGWYSIRRDHTTVRIKNPVDQARRNKHALIDKLRTLPNWQGQAPTIGHAVAFPDGITDLPDFGPDMPREIVFLHDNLAAVEKWLRSCLAFWAGDHFVPPGDAGVLAIRDVLRRSWLMREPMLGEEIGPQAIAIQRYTEDQFRMLDWLAGRPRAAIRGCAGSGKTVLAIEKARRLAREGFRTLLTCYNPALARELRQLTGLPVRLKIQSFHALCQEYASLTGRDKKADWNDARPDFFDVIMPEALFDMATKVGEAGQFDAIVVDEGQDFRENWWLSLQMLLKESEAGILYVFYDDNQLVYSHKLSLPVTEAPFGLTTNCRNTRQIHHAVSTFYKSDLKITVRGPEGRPVVFKTYGDGMPNLRAHLTESLARLVFAEKIKAQDIVILSPGGLDRPPLQDVGRPGAFSLVSENAVRDDQILCTTIRVFKGRERPVVVLIIPVGAEPRDELLYVGLSRASSYLEVLLHENLADPVYDRLRLEGVTIA